MVFLVISWVKQRIFHGFYGSFFLPPFFTHPSPHFTHFPSFPFSWSILTLCPSTLFFPLHLLSLLSILLYFLHIFLICFGRKKRRGRTDPGSDHFSRLNYSIILIITMKGERKIGVNNNEPTKQRQ